VGNNCTVAYISIDKCRTLFVVQTDVMCCGRICYRVVIRAYAAVNRSIAHLYSGVFKFVVQRLCRSFAARNFCTVVLHLCCTAVETDTIIVVNLIFVKA